MFSKREWVMASFSLLLVTIFLQLSHGGLRKCVAATPRNDTPHLTQSFSTLSAHGASLFSGH
ncbi:MAG: hypothetical protein H6Q33_2462 [Deltaproteobacteria bacterium]|nr:hypothetical protein [Deltaproteobacteria bacterium]